MYINAMYIRERIVLNTIDVISEFGIHLVSTKEIAKRVGVSEGTIFRYFPKKNNLLNAVLEHYSQYDDDIFHAAREKKMQPEEAIIFYIDSYMAYYENYPAITAITQAYDILKDIPGLGEKVRSIFTNRSSCMRELIEEAQKTGVLSKDVDADNLTDIITSACRGICLKWRMNNFDFSLRGKTLNVVSMLLDAFSNREKI